MYTILKSLLMLIDDLGSLDDRLREFQDDHPQIVALTEEWRRVVLSQRNGLECYSGFRDIEPLRLAFMPGRFRLALSYFQQPLSQLLNWLITSKERTNFTYDLTDLNKLHLAWFVSTIVGESIDKIRKYIRELEEDQDLQQHIRTVVSNSKYNVVSDEEGRYGRRLGWYAFVRSIKPRVVVETGVDKGLGTCVLAAALRKNLKEGYPGYLYAIDIDRNAGYLFKSPYNQIGKILYGDSIQLLKDFEDRIDLFIHDSNHSPEYERGEFYTIRTKLNDDALILSDNHDTVELAEFAELTGRKYLFFQEKPKDHFYPGAGIGVAFPRSVEKPTKKSVSKTDKFRSRDRINPRVVYVNPEEKTLMSRRSAKPTCLFLNTYYQGFLERHYKTNPQLHETPYLVQKRSLQMEFFGDCDFYSRGLKLAGWNADDLIINCIPLQQTWAQENNFTGTGLAIAVEQIRRINPQVVYLQDLGLGTSEFLAAIRPNTDLIVGQIASPIPMRADLTNFDIIFSSFPHFVQNFREKGITAYYQPLAFDPRILDHLIIEHEDRYPVTFVGGISGNHQKRTEFLEALSAQVPINFWGYGVGTLPEKSLIRKKHRGQIWGLDMFSVLHRSNITINTHIDVAGNYANNMRLFEATGCAALLITDYKDNLNELFEIGKEVVAYRSSAECSALIKYYLTHPQEAQQIALAGQRRTLTEHTYNRRMQQTAEILGRHLKYRHQAERNSQSDFSKISYGYSRLQSSDITEKMTTAWQSPEIPEKQRALVQQQLLAMYRGKVAVEFRVLAEILRPYVSPGCSILEIGCASGYYYEILEYLLDKRIDYTGVDYSAPLIRMARDYYPRANFEIADGANLFFKDKKYHIVISSCVLLHVPNYAEHIKETARVAAGYVVAHRTPVCRNASTQYFKKFAYGVETIELRFNEDELISKFESHGLKLINFIEYYSNSTEDQFEVTYLFRKTD